MRSMLQLACVAALALGSPGLSVVVSGPAAAAEPSPLPEDPLTKFKELSAKAETAFQAGQYQGAVDAYLEAYGVVASPDVLYNIAYLYDRHLGQTELAQDFYRRVIRTPDSSKEIIELSMKRLAELEPKSIATPAPAPAPAPDVGKPADGGKPAVADATTSGDNTATKKLERDSGPGPGPWVAIGVGGAALLGGIVAGILAQGTNDDFQSAADIDDKRRLEDDGKSQALASDILTFGGGALIVSGVIWYVLASDGEPAAAPATTTLELPPLRPLVTRDGIGLAYGGHL